MLTSISISISVSKRVFNRCHARTCIENSTGRKRQQYAILYVYAYMQMRCASHENFLTPCISFLSKTLRSWCEFIYLKRFKSSRESVVIGESKNFRSRVDRVLSILVARFSVLLWKKRRRKVCPWSTIFKATRYCSDRDQNCNKECRPITTPCLRQTHVKRCVWRFALQWRWIAMA